MLKKRDSYFISKGLSKNYDKLDLNQTIVLNNYVKQNNLGYSYGELN